MIIRLIYIIVSLSTFFSVYAYSSTEQLIVDLTYLSSDTLQGRKTNTLGAAASAQFLQTRFNELGYNPELQSFTYSSGFFSKAEGKNIIARLTTDSKTKPWLVITAHYDHLGLKGGRHYPGANDNASGVSALLYLADSLRAKPPEFNVLFIATDAEENGLHGSQFFVSQLKVTAKVLNINLDMLALKTRDPTLYAFTSYKQKQKIIDLSTKVAKKDIKVRVSSSNKQMHRRIKNGRINWRKASDHYSFSKAGIPFIYFGMGYDKHHHKPSDTIENIDKTLYINTVIYIEKFIHQLDFSVL